MAELNRFYDLDERRPDWPERVLLLCGDCEDGEKDQYRVDRVTVAEGSVSDVVNERVEQGENYQWNGQGVFCASEEKSAESGADGEQKVTQEDDSNQKRIGTEKIGDGMFGAEPRGNDSFAGELKEKSGLFLDE
jgi:hypothetical protein